jgi:hypothetical protein
MKEIKISILLFIKHACRTKELLAELIAKIYVCDRHAYRDELTGTRDD